MATLMSIRPSTDMAFSSIVVWEKAAHSVEGTTSKHTIIKWRYVYCSQDGDIGHSWSSWVRVRVHLSSDAAMALAVDTAPCAHVDAAAADKFKAAIREATAKAAHKASLKRARGNADDPTPPPAPSTPSAPPARKKSGIAAAFSCVVAACVGMIRSSRA